MLTELADAAAGFVVKIILVVGVGLLAVGIGIGYLVAK
jgi:hypothetical protein